MAKCPACDYQVRTPAFFNLDGWSHLVCSQCKARLEMKPRAVGFWVLPILASMSWLGRKGHIYAVLAEVLLLCAMVTIVLMLIVHPQVRLRKRALPKPEVRLNINGPSN
jgi:hypothetical protein